MASPCSVERSRLRRRADFLKLRSGPKYGCKGFLIQARRRDAAEGHACDGARFGYTVTRKLGNAVVRNRIRRRLKEAVRTTPDLAIEPQCDYVLVGRRAALDMPFDDLQSELARALRHLARKLPPRNEEISAEPNPAD